MEFPKATPHRKSLTIVDLIVFTAILAMIFAGVRPPMPSHVTRLVSFIFFAGCLILWLRGLKVRRLWDEIIVAVAYMFLVFAAFFLYVSVCIANPARLIPIIVAQLFAILYVSIRT